MTSNSGSFSETGNSTVKKFDKKAWRRQKYDHKFKVEQWTEQKKKILKSRLHRELKKSGQTDILPPPPRPTSSTVLSSPDRSVKPPSRLEAARQVFEKKRREKQEARQAQEKKRQEIAEALERHKKRRIQNVKILSKKTKKGQPLMRGRMELLFEKVKQQVGCGDQT